MEKQAKTHCCLIIMFSVILLILHYASGVEKIIQTVLLCAIVIVLFVIISQSINNSSYPSSCRKMLFTKTMKTFYAGQTFWLIMLIVKAAHLPLLYEDLILTPLLIALLALLIISGVNVYKIRVEIEKGTYRDDQKD